MKKYISYAFVFVIALFMSFNSVFADDVRVCYYKQGNDVVAVMLHEYYVEAYLKKEGAGWNQKLQTEFTREEFMPGNFLDSSNACPQEIYKTLGSKLILEKRGLFSGGFGDSTLSLDKSSGNNGSQIGSGNSPEFDNLPQQFTPPGGPSILTGTCPTNLGFVKLLSTLYGLLKIAAPILLIIFGMLDFAKAVASTDESKMKKAQSAFVRRLIAAIVVFLVMSLMTLLSNLIPEESGVFSCVKSILK